MCFAHLSSSAALIFWIFQDFQDTKDGEDEDEFEVGFGMARWVDRDPLLMACYKPYMIGENIIPYVKEPTRVK